MAVIRLADPKKDARQVAAIYFPYVINTPITFESEPPDGKEMSPGMKTEGEDPELYKRVYTFGQIL